MKGSVCFLAISFILLTGCSNSPEETNAESKNLEAIWHKESGKYPTMKVLFLHGGPGGTHEVFDCFDGYFPSEGIEYIYYDQLGSYFSDQPSDTSLWTIERFVDKVEQVRLALGLNKENFYLLGQSWGGILAMEYALKFQEQIKGLIISNMMSSVSDYNRYAQEVLGPRMDPEVLQELMEIEARNDFSNPRYMDLLMEHFYTEHLMRMPVNKWPQSVNLAFRHMNPEVYVRPGSGGPFFTLPQWKSPLSI